MAQVKLLIPPEVRFFDRNREQEFVDTVSSLSKRSVDIPISAKSMITLTADCLTVLGDCRFSAVGLRQVCDVMSPGLYRTMVSLASGLDCVGGQARAISDAVRIYNIVVAIRGDTLTTGYRLLKNVQEKTIDGMMGANYTRVANDRIREAARDAMGGAGEFLSAMLFGRKMILRYIAKKPLFTYSGDEYHLGYHFVNSEVARESSVRAAVCIVRRSDNSVMLGKFLGNKLIHTSRRFEERLANVFSSVSRAADSVTERRSTFVTRLQTLSETPLRVGGSESDREHRFNEVVAALTIRGLPKTEAVNVVNLALQRGGQISGSPSMRTSTSTVATRSALDLCYALMVTGRQRTGTASECLEQAAWGLMQGVFKV